MNIKQIILAIGLLTAHLGLSQDQALFSQATRLYNQGEYAQALENYEKILGNGKHSTALYFNMGNCHYKMGNIGPGIYYYEKALLLSPKDGEVLNNLAYAQNMRLDAIQEMPKSEIGEFYDRTLSLLTYDQWAYAAVIWIMLFVAAYLCYYFLRAANHKRIALISGLFALVLGAVSLLFSFLEQQRFNNDNPAIVFAKQVKVSSEPNTGSSPVFTLHEGTKVKVVEALGDWEKIRLSDGQTGWLLAESIKKLKDF